MSYVDNYHHYNNDTSDQSYYFNGNQANSNIKSVLTHAPTQPTDAYNYYYYENNNNSSMMFEENPFNENLYSNKSNYTQEIKSNDNLLVYYQFVNSFQVPNYEKQQHEDLLHINSTPLLTPSPQLSTEYSEPSRSSESSNSFESIHLFSPMKKRAPLRKKKQIPMTDKKFICEVCDHRSKRRHNLIEHMLTHNPNRPKSFVCKFCSRPFARKYDMKRHEKIHTR